MRYTLDKSNVRNGLFNVLDNGQPTKAFAVEHVTFSDRCEVTDGTFHDGTFHDGWFRGGTFRGGTFHGGTFHDGWFHDGTFHDGVFRGGWFRGGVFHDGTFHDGWFRGGTFHGGTFHGGTFHDGWFRGGWLPLQIQGSRHFVNIPDGKTIAIGCQVHSPEYWIENFETIGLEHDYTPEQIVEYREYIDIAYNAIKRSQK